MLASHPGVTAVRPPRCRNVHRSPVTRRRGSDRRSQGRVSPRCAYAAAGATRPRGRAPEQPALQQERLVDVLDGVGLLGHRHRQRAESDGLAGERLAQRPQDRPVDLVEAELVDVEERECLVGDRAGDRCRRLAPRRSRGRAAATGSRCAACPGPGARSRWRRRARARRPGCRAARSMMATRSVGLVVVEAGRRSRTGRAADRRSCRCAWSPRRA